MTLRLVSFAGLLVMILIAWGLSENRRRAPWRLVLAGVLLQFAIGLLLLKTPAHGAAFSGMAVAVSVLTDSTLQGARFVFGILPDDPNIGAILGFQVLPVIIFVSAISAILVHLRVIQVVVQAIAWLMRRTLKTSGAETFCAALLIFLGIESVSAVRVYLKNMTRSELCVIMTTFMATIAGSVMVVYASVFGAEPGHLLTASLMSAPAAILISKLLVPETETPETSGQSRISTPVETQNIMDAAAQGTAQGLSMALHVGATLIVFIGLVYLLDLVLKAVIGYTFVDVLGGCFVPFAYLMGIPSADVHTVAELLGTKSVLNEFLAYDQLHQVVEAGKLSPRAITIATYALCGFANPGSIGIAIAALDALAPERRKEIASLGVKSFIGGTLACFITACIAGIIVYE